MRKKEKINRKLRKCEKGGEKEKKNVNRKEERAIEWKRKRKEKGMRLK